MERSDLGDSLVNQESGACLDLKAHLVSQAQME